MRQVARRVDQKVPIGIHRYRRTHQGVGGHILQEYLAGIARLAASASVSLTVMLVSTATPVASSIGLEPGAFKVGFVVSSVKASAADAAPVLPAPSLWRTVMLLAPSPLSVTPVPVPAIQLVPPFRLYAQVAPHSPDR